MSTSATSATVRSIAPGPRTSLSTNFQAPSGGREGTRAHKLATASRCRGGSGDPRVDPAPHHAVLATTHTKLVWVPLRLCTKSPSYDDVEGQSKRHASAVPGAHVSRSSPAVRRISASTSGRERPQAGLPLVDQPADVDQRREDRLVPRVQGLHALRPVPRRDAPGHRQPCQESRERPPRLLGVGTGRPSSASARARRSPRSAGCAVRDSPPGRAAPACPAPPRGRPSRAAAGPG